VDDDSRAVVLSWSTSDASTYALDIEVPFLRL
jgi:hypothetical protein